MEEEEEEGGRPLSLFFLFWEGEELLAPASAFHYGQKGSTNAQKDAQKMVGGSIDILRGACETLISAADSSVAQKSLDDALN